MYAPKYGGRKNYLNKLREYYNGYFFTKEKKAVYNIFGILNHFDNSAEFEPYESRSGWPTFALKYFEKKNINAAEIEEAEMEAGNFGDYRDDTITLFQHHQYAGAALLQRSSYRKRQNRQRHFCRRLHLYF